MRGGDGRVADVGVDLDQEVAADDHRLELRVVDVGRDDGPRATSSRTNSGVMISGMLREVLGDAGRAALAIALAHRAWRDSRIHFWPLVLADRDVFHLGVMMPRGRSASARCRSALAGDVDLGCEPVSGVRVRATRSSTAAPVFVGRLGAACQGVHAVSSGNLRTVAGCAVCRDAGDDRVTGPASRGLAAGGKRRAATRVRTGAAGRRPRGGQGQGAGPGEALLRRSQPDQVQRVCVRPWPVASGKSSPGGRPHASQPLAGTPERSPAV